MLFNKPSSGKIPLVSKMSLNLADISFSLSFFASGVLAYSFGNAPVQCYFLNKPFYKTQLRPVVDIYFICRRIKPWRRDKQQTVEEMNAVLRTGSFYFLQLFQEQEGMFRKFPVTQRYARQQKKPRGLSFHFLISFSCSTWFLKCRSQ